MKTIISFIGAPNSGKTTAALYLASKIKQKGFKCDFIPEVARELIYRYKGFEHKPNQLLISGMQISRIVEALAVQDIIVTDTDIELGANFIGHHSEEYLEILREEYKRELEKVAKEVYCFQMKCVKPYFKWQLRELTEGAIQFLITRRVNCLKPLAHTFRIYP